MRPHEGHDLCRRTRPRQPRHLSPAIRALLWAIGPLLLQSTAQGALPTLYAATAPDVKSGEYFGPDGFLAMKGHPARNEPAQRAKDLTAAAALWQHSEELTGTSFPG